MGDSRRWELFEICNEIYLQGEWPKDFFESVIIPVVKKLGAKECVDFRTIPHASKVVRKILTWRLENKADSYLGMISGMVSERGVLQEMLLQLGGYYMKEVWNITVKSIFVMLIMKRLLIAWTGSNWWRHFERLLLTGLTDFICTSRQYRNKVRRLKIAMCRTGRSETH